MILTTGLGSKLPAALASALNTPPPHIDLLTNGVTSVLCSTLDTVAPLKKRIRKQKRLSPWYIDHTRALQQITRKPPNSHLAWRDSLISYKKNFPMFL